MTGRWATSNRRAELPSNWRELRWERFELDDFTCVDCGHRDPTGATLEADHVGDRHDHRIGQLRTRCGRGTENNCHGRHTQEQAAAARAAMPKANRPRPRHPGLLG